MIGESSFGIYHGGATVDEIAKAYGDSPLGRKAPRLNTRESLHVAGKNAQEVGRSALKAGKTFGALHKKPLIAGAAGAAALAGGGAVAHNRMKRS